MSQAIQVSPTTWSLALRTPTLPPATSTNTVAFVGESMVVVEPATPFAEQQRSLDAFIEARRVEGHPVQGLLITHHHADHTGYVRDLRQRLGVPLLAHGETAVRVPFEVDAWIEDGEVIDLGAGVSLEAVLTPGHAPGHLVFVERSTAVAHVGDMVAGEGFILIDPDDGGSMRAYLDSLERMKQLGLSCLVPAHGPIIDQPLEVLGRYIEHRLAREAKVVAAVRTSSEFEGILARAYADTPAFAMPLAARSLRAHLDKLLDDGVVTVEAGRWHSTR